MAYNPNDPEVILDRLQRLSSRLEEEGRYVESDIAFLAAELIKQLTPKPWSGGECPIDPANCWVDDETGEHVNALTNVRTKEHPDG